MILQELIAQHHDPKLAEVDGMVYQVWEDGEVTLQKCGDLLWQRSLHRIKMGDPSKAVDPKLFPCQSNGHGYAFVTQGGADAIRNHILNFEWK